MVWVVGIIRDNSIYFFVAVIKLKISKRAYWACDSPKELLIGSSVVSIRSLGRTQSHFPFSGRGFFFSETYVAQDWVQVDTAPDLLWSSSLREDFDLSYQGHSRFLRQSWNCNWWLGISVLNFLYFLCTRLFESSFFPRVFCVGRIIWTCVSFPISAHLKNSRADCLARRIICSNLSSNFCANKNGAFE